MAGQRRVDTVESYAPLLCLNVDVVDIVDDPGTTHEHARLLVVFEKLTPRPKINERVFSLPFYQEEHKL